MTMRPWNFQLCGRITIIFSEGNKRASTRNWRRTRYSNWILGSSTESAYLAADYLYVCESFCSAQLLNAIRIYRNNFQPEQLKEPYVVACVNVIAADSDKEAARLATFKRLFLGILTGNRQQLKEAVDPGEGFMDPWKKHFTTNDCLYFIGGPEK
jgi:alkanesulfonate monooxygenase SsuD/methylene tetrahydromethanopterin reductase-like flavin-dependent oxidoreductase (luciferase family)